MSAALSLSNLSIESAEVDFSERVDPEAGFRDQIENPIFSKEYEDAELVFATFKNINDRGFVCRADIEQVAPLADSYPTIKRMMTRYPLGSFTEEPSRVNYEVSTESIIRSVLTALKEAFFKILKFLRESLTRVWDNLVNGRKRTVEVDKIGPRLDAMQRYMLEVDKLMNDSKVAAEYAPWQRRNIASAAQNLSKNWNALKHEVTVNQATAKEAVTTFVDALVLRTVPMAIMIEGVIEDLTNARTAGDVGAAVAKGQMFDMTTPVMAKLASTLGFKPGAVRTDPRLTPFKSMVSYIAGAYRSQSNNRMDIKAETLTEVMSSLRIDPWGDIVPNLVDNRKRLARSLSALEHFDVDKYLDPGLESVYTAIVIPFINQVSVNVSALNDLEAVASMMIATRDSAVLDVANTALGVVKGMDSFVGKNRADVSPAAMITITRLKAAVAQSI